MEERDVLGTEKISKLFIKFSLPAIVAQLVNLLYNMVDRIFVGHIPEIGPTALTGIGVSMPIIIVISAFASLVAMGGAPLASIALGKRDQEEAEEIMHTTFVSLIVLAIVLSIIVSIFKRPILMAFGASENTIQYGVDYLGIYALGTIFVLITLGMNLFINSQGFAKESMITTVIGAVLNIILDPIFIFALNMGVKGAALATIISQGVSALWVLRFLTSDRTKLKLEKKKMKWKKQIFSKIVGLGISPFIMQSTESLLQIAFNTSLLRYGGDYYVGAMTVVGTVMQLLQLPMFGLTQGAQPIMSYNYGAKKNDRVLKTFKILLKSCVSYSILFFIIVLFKPSFFINLFTKDPEFAEIIKKVMRVYMGGVFITGLQVACQQSFLALGQARQSLLLALLRKVILLIPLIYILPLMMSNKVFAVILAEPIADIAAGIITGVTFFLFLKKEILNQNVTANESL